MKRYVIDKESGRVAASRNGHGMTMAQAMDYLRTRYSDPEAFDAMVEQMHARIASDVEAALRCHRSRLSRIPIDARVVR